MSDRPLAEVARGWEELRRVARAFGSIPEEPFMVLSFLALPVIPELKLTDRGLVDVNRFEHVPLFAGDRRVMALSVIPLHRYVYPWDSWPHFRYDFKETFSPIKEVDMKTYSIALIGGDGIGPEILREGKKVMDAAAEVAGITWQWKEYPYGADHWLQYRKG